MDPNNIEEPGLKDLAADEEEVEEEEDEDEDEDEEDEDDGQWQNRWERWVQRHCNVPNYRPTKTFLDGFNLKSLRAALLLWLHEAEGIAERVTDENARRDEDDKVIGFSVIEYTWPERYDEDDFDEDDFENDLDGGDTPPDDIDPDLVDRHETWFCQQKWFFGLAALIALWSDREKTGIDTSPLLVYAGQLRDRGATWASIAYDSSRRPLYELLDYADLVKGLRNAQAVVYRLVNLVDLKNADAGIPEPVETPAELTLRPRAKRLKPKSEFRWGPVTGELKEIASWAGWKQGRTVRDNHGRTCWVEEDGNLFHVWFFRETRYLKAKKLMDECAQKR